MSGLAKSYEKAIYKELRAHAAWLPVTNTLKVGDYGFFEGGVFRSIGNLTDKYPELSLKVEQGPSTKIDFTTEGTKTVKLNASGETTDSFARLGDAKASLKFEFTKKNSVVVKINEINVEQLQNIEEVADFLVSKDNWKKKYKVISATYSGNDCLVVCAREAGTEFQISGSANLLKAVESGKAEAGLEISSSKSSAFNSVGESGVVALRMFKLNWRGSLKLLKDDQQPDYSIDDKFGIRIDGGMDNDF